MTVIEFADRVLLAVAIFAVVTAFRKFARWRSGQIDAMNRHRSVFYRAAAALIEDDETPELVTRQLAFIMKAMDKPEIGRLLLAAAVFGNLIRSFRAPSERMKELGHALDKMHPPLRHQYVVAMSRGLLAATFANVILGPVIRRTVLYWAIGNHELNGVGTVVSNVEARYQKSHHGDPENHATLVPA